MLTIAPSNKCCSVGVIAYYGDLLRFISVELFDGRIKVAFLLNAPQSMIYSYSKGLPFFEQANTKDLRFSERRSSSQA